MGYDKNPAWLGDVYGYIRCPFCTHRYKASEMHIDGEANDQYQVHVRKCARCGAGAFILLGKDVLQQILKAAGKAHDPLCPDDVLDAHDALKAREWRLKDILPPGSKA